MRVDSLGAVEGSEAVAASMAADSGAVASTAPGQAASAVDIVAASLAVIAAGTDESAATVTQESAVTATDTVPVTGSPRLGSALQLPLATTARLMEDVDRTPTTTAILAPAVPTD